MAKSREEAIDKAYEEGTPDDYDHPENWEIDDADEY